MWKNEKHDTWFDTSSFQGRHQAVVSHMVGTATEVTANGKIVEEFVMRMLHNIFTLRSNIWISSGISKVSSPVWYFKNLETQINKQIGQIGYFNNLEIQMKIHKEIQITTKIGEN